MALGIEVETLQPNTGDDYIVFNGELSSLDTDRYDYAVLYFLYDDDESFEDYSYSDLDYTQEEPSVNFSYTLSVVRPVKIYYKAMGVGVSNTENIEYVMDMIRYEPSDISGDFEFVFYE